VFEVSTEEEALSLLFLGSANRVTASTKMNDASSRSHAIFAISITQRTSKASGKKRGASVTTGKMNIVDLAGSERVDKVDHYVSGLRVESGFEGGDAAPGRQQKEGQNINLSLHHLQQVVIALQQKSLNPKAAVHVP
jgi:kinesin family protein 6/9